MDIFADDTTLSSSSLWNDVGTLRSDLGNSGITSQGLVKTKSSSSQHQKKTKSMLITGKRLGSKLSPEDLTLGIETSNNIKLDHYFYFKLNSKVSVNEGTSVLFSFLKK